MNILIGVIVLLLIIYYWLKYAYKKLSKKQQILKKLKEQAEDLKDFNMYYKLSCNANKIVEKMKAEGCNLDDYVMVLPPPWEKVIKGRRVCGLYVFYNSALKDDQAVIIRKPVIKIEIPENIQPDNKMQELWTLYGGLN